VFTVNLLPGRVSPKRNVWKWYTHSPDAHNELSTWVCVDGNQAWMKAVGLADAYRVLGVKREPDVASTKRFSVQDVVDLLQPVPFGGVREFFSRLGEGKFLYYRQRALMLSRRIQNEVVQDLVYERPGSARAAAPGTTAQ